MGQSFHYGGQAVIEGVMMRGRKAVVTAVRRPGGELAMDIKPLTGIYTSRLRKAPLIRGVIVLIEAMVLGIKTLFYSANVSLEEEDEKISGGVVWITLVVALAMAVALFFLAPLFLARLLNPYISSSLVFHLIEGCIRLAIFIAYLRVMAFMSDIRRIFAYHGAEHKVVNAYESGVPLELKAVKEYSTAHLRCGTSFIFIVLVMAILAFALIGRLPSVWLMVLSRVVLIPVLAALGYEVTRFSGYHTKNRLVRAILSPGLLLQKLTTREPDDSQLEVALAALNKAVEIDQPEAKPQPAP